MLGRAGLTILGFAVLLLAACAIRLMLGPASAGFGWPGDDLVLELRATRVVSGLVVGGSLGLAGVLLQNLLRNPLASPDLVGVSGGAGFGVLLAAFLAYQAGGAIPASASPIAALLGASSALAVVYGAAQRGGLIDPISLILVGVIVGLICGSGATAVQSMLPPDPSRPVARWMFGALNDDTGWPVLGVTGAVLIAGLVWATVSARTLDAAVLSEDEARAIGVRIGRLRLGLFLWSGSLTAGSVVLAGPIGFVGLVCPHLVRLLAGPRHGPLVIGSVLAGAALVVGADGLVRVIDLGSGRLPIGVLTTLLGGPVFLVLLRNARVTR
ncbi:MAG: iron ABC transporter permease [Planctomycetota bacterium]